jgi:hypothetical protein
MVNYGTYYTFSTTRYILLSWIRIQFWPDPDPVCSQTLDTDPVQIGPDPQHWNQPLDGEMPDSNPEP